MVDTNYWLKPGESTDAYNTRMSAYYQSNPVTTLSSQSGQQYVAQNTNSLQTMEAAYQPQQQQTGGTGTQSSSYTVQKGDTLSGIAQSQGTTTGNISGYKSGDPNKIYPGEQLTILKNISGSPAANQMVNDINQSVQGGGLSEQELAGLKNLTSTQDALMAASAAARGALTGKDYSSMDTYVKRAEELQKEYSTQLADYYKAVAPLRQRQMDLLSPTAREKELSQSLIDIRTQVDQFNLATQKNQLAEFEGQTQGFATGRANEMDRNASFARQEMALKEKNLLLSLGLEQESRKMEGEAVGQQLSNLADDFELQKGVQDRITQMEEQIFDRADQLEGNAKDTLIRIVDMLQGVDPKNIPINTKAQLETLAARAGLPYDLVVQALQTQYDRQTYEDLIAEKKETRLASESGTSGGTGTTYKFTPTQYNKGASNAGLTLSSFKALDGDVQNFFVNLSPTASQALKDEIANVNNGTDSYDEFVEYVKSRGIPQSVQDYLLSLVKAPAKSSSGSSLYDKAATVAKTVNTTVDNVVEAGWKKVSSWLGL